MALNLILYKNFNKRTNSTKQPATGETVAVTLKAPTSLINPVFIIAGVDTDINYCKFSGRYYWVDDIVIISNDICELHCSVDVLATYRANILASTQYVTRSASESDRFVLDSMYPARATANYVNNSLTNPFGTVSECYYLVGVVGPNVFPSEYSGASAGTGSTQYYLLNGTQLNHILYMLMQDEVTSKTFFNIDENVMDLQLQKAILNPLKYFVSIKKVPKFIKRAGTYLYEYSVSSIKLGWNYSIPIGSNAVAIVPRISTLTFEVDIPKHPNADERGQYLNVAPISNYTLYLEPFGLIPLDTTKLIGLDKIICDIVVDEITGDAVLNIKANSSPYSHNIAFSRGNVYVDLQVSQISQNYYSQQKASLGAMSSAVGAVSAGATGNIAGAVSGAIGVASSIVDANIASIPQIEKTGSNGSNIIYNHTPKLYCEFKSLVGEDNADLGRPLMKTRTLSALSGYCKCNDADIALSATSNEIDQVKSFLNGGFFIE